MSRTKKILIGLLISISPLPCAGVMPGGNAPKPLPPGGEPVSAAAAAKIVPPAPALNIGGSTEKPLGDMPPALTPSEVVPPAPTLPAPATPAPLPTPPSEHKPVLLPQLLKEGEELHQIPRTQDPQTTQALGKNLSKIYGEGRNVGINLADRDLSVRPQDDFFRHMNGTWITNTSIPADKVRYGFDDQLQDRSEKIVHAIITDLAAKTQAPESNEERVANLYNSFMDTERVESLGLQPLADDFARIQALSSKTELPSFFAQSLSAGIDSPLGLYVARDEKDVSKHITKLGQSGLGLPDRDYYFNQDARSAGIRKAYVQYVTTLFKLAGEDHAAEKAQTVFSLEEALAKHQWTREENDDVDKTYNKVLISGLPALAGLDWAGYLQAAGIRSEESSVIVNQPSYFTGLVQVLADQPLENWKLYMKARLLEGATPYLPSAFVDARFAYIRTLSGQAEMKPRWKRGVALVNGAVGESVGKLYVEKHFPKSSKQRVLQLVENIRAAFAERIQGLEWMSSETKKLALEKLKKLRLKIGYPSRWKDYSMLQTLAGDLMGNVRRSNRFDYDQMIAKLGQPIDRDAWDMLPQTVNAYNNFYLNEMVLPAAILQAPYFDPDADDAANYGAIGASTLGHEMTHAFDNTGAKFNSDGMLQDWWTPKDKAAFEARSGLLVSQYNAFEPLPGQHINGKLTLGENIADLAGLIIAHRAYRLSLGGREAPIIEGLTGDQRFFLAFAYSWQQILRKEFLSLSLETDEHAPAEYRVNGVVPNMPEFHEAFNVQEGDKLFLPKDKRARIW